MHAIYFNILRYLSVAQQRRDAIAYTMIGERYVCLSNYINILD